MSGYDHLTYIAPTALEEALDHMKRGRDVAVLAGGTDLIPLMKYGVKKPEGLMSLDKVPRLRGIEVAGNELSIGAMTTLTDLSKDEKVNRSFPAVGRSARSVASPQIRNVGTIGGNVLQERRCIYFNQTAYWRSNVAPCFKLGGDLCHQAPGSKSCRALYYSDLAPVLLAYDASVEVYNRMGEPEIVPLSAVVHDHVSDRLDPCLISRFLLPNAGADAWGTFVKYSVREAIDFAVANAAVRYSPSRQGEEAVRIFVGAASPEPIELEETQAYLAANSHQLSSHKEKVIALALKEAISKSAFVRETGISMSVKKSALHVVAEALEAFFRIV